jgi:polyhydroxyalkanoate synthesis regulator protein
MTPEPMLIKRYGKHRLYNTATATYVSEAELEEMVLTGEHFVIVDAKTGKVITGELLERLH